MTRVNTAIRMNQNTLDHLSAAAALNNVSRSEQANRFLDESLMDIKSVFSYIFDSDRPIMNVSSDNITVSFMLDGRARDQLDEYARRIGTSRNHIFDISMRYALRDIIRHS